MSSDENDDDNDNGDNIIAILLNNAYQDTQVLITNEREGDVFSIDRDVEFNFRVHENKRAETVRNFIDDNRYGNAVIEDDGQAGFRLSVHSHADPPKRSVLGIRSHGLPGPLFQH